MTAPTNTPLTQEETIASLGSYEYGWHDSDDAGASAERGLNEEVVRRISALKNEPEWMRDLRLKGLRLFDKKPMPHWGSDLSGIDFDNIKYFVRSTEKQASSWEDLPDDIKETYDKLGIPEAEKQRLVAGVAAQYESEVVYHQIREDLEEQGVIFVDTDTGLKEHEDIFKEYFGSVIPVGDNKFAALNTAVWSGGSFVYVPPGVHVEIPLQAYFRINTENMGQFERTLIIADEGSYVHYVEGCTAPIYSSDSLHSAVVEIVVKKNARVRGALLSGRPVRNDQGFTLIELMCAATVATLGVVMALGATLGTVQTSVQSEGRAAAKVVLGEPDHLFSANGHERDVERGHRAVRQCLQHDQPRQDARGTIKVAAVGNAVEM